MLSIFENIIKCRIGYFVHILINRPKVVGCAGGVLDVPFINDIGLRRIHKRDYYTYNLDKWL